MDRYLDDVILGFVFMRLEIWVIFMWMFVGYDRW